MIVRRQRVRRGLCETRRQAVHDGSDTVIINSGQLKWAACVCANQVSWCRGGELVAGNWLQWCSVIHKQ